MRDSSRFLLLVPPPAICMALFTLHAGRTHENEFIQWVSRPAVGRPIAPKFSTLAWNHSSLLLKCCSEGPQIQMPWGGQAQVEHLAGPVQWAKLEGGFQHFHHHPLGWAKLCRTKAHPPEARGKAMRLAHQGLVVDLLPDKLVLTQRIAGLPRDGVDGPLLHLLLDGTEQREEGLPSTLLVTEENRAGRALDHRCRAQPS